MTKSYQPIPELDELLEEKEEEYDTGDVSVKVVELNTVNMGGRFTRVTKNESDDEVAQSSSDAETSFEEKVPGMEIEPIKNQPKPKRKNDVEETNEESQLFPKNKKELNKILKKQATSSLKKTKAFQIKRKMDKIKDKKKFRREQSQKARQTGDSNKKHGKKFKKDSKSRKQKK